MPLTNRVIAALLETVGGADVVVEAWLTALTLLKATVVELDTFGAVVVALTVLLTIGPWLLVLVGIEELATVEALVVAVEVVVAFVSAALYCEHRARPMDWMAGSWVAGQALKRQVPTMASMEA
jgi:hypothetical protein